MRELYIMPGISYLLLTTVTDDPVHLQILVMALENSNGKANSYCGRSQFELAVLILHAFSGAI